MKPGFKSNWFPCQSTRKSTRGRRSSHYPVLLQPNGLGRKKKKENWIHTLGLRGGSLPCAWDALFVLQASNACLLVEPVVRATRNGKVMEQSLPLDWYFLRPRAASRSFALLEANTHHHLLSSLALYLTLDQSLTYSTSCPFTPLYSQKGN